MSKYKLDIFDTLENIDFKNSDFYVSLTDEKKKSFWEWLWKK